MRLNARWIPIVVAAALIGTGSTSAGTAGGTNEDATAIIRSLAPTAPSSISTVAPSRPRAVRPLRVTVRSPATRNVVAVVIDREYSLDFDVFFDFDSAKLTPRAKSSLRALGDALASPQLASHSFLIAGHTDAKGSAAYNRALSADRADSVAQFLVQEFPISPERLYTTGFGESQLRAPGQPNAGVNRRVEVALIVD